MRHNPILAVIGLALLPSIAASADTTTGRVYHIGGGVGAVECPRFVATMDRAKKAGAGTLEYVNEINGFEMYVSGFQTAYNPSNTEHL